MVAHGVWAKQRTDSLSIAACPTQPVNKCVCHSGTALVAAYWWHRGRGSLCSSPRWLLMVSPSQYMAPLQQLAPLVAAYWSVETCCMADLEQHPVAAYWSQEVCCTAPVSQPQVAACWRDKGCVHVGDCQMPLCGRLPRQPGGSWCALPPGGLPLPMTSYPPP